MRCRIATTLLPLLLFCACENALESRLRTLGLQYSINGRSYRTEIEPPNGKRTRIVASGPAQVTVDLIVVTVPAAPSAVRSRMLTLRRDADGHTPCWDLQRTFESSWQSLPPASTTGTAAGALNIADVDVEVPTTLASVPAGAYMIRFELELKPTHGATPKIVDVTDVAILPKDSFAAWSNWNRLRNVNILHDSAKSRRKCGN